MTTLSVFLYAAAPQIPPPMQQKAPAPPPPSGLRYVAVYDYTAAADDEVSFQEGTDGLSHSFFLSLSPPFLSLHPSFSPTPLFPQFPVLSFSIFLFLFSNPPPVTVHNYCAIILPFRWCHYRCDSDWWGLDGRSRGAYRRLWNAALQLRRETVETL